MHLFSYTSLSASLRGDAPSHRRVHPRAQRRPVAARGLIATFALLLTSGTTAFAQGITYTLSPAASSINWDSDLGLKNHSLYGGQASIDFERLVSLQGYYFTNSKINSAVDKLGLSGDLASQLKDQRLEVRSFGANVIWKFWNGGIAPYLKTGGGILQLTPDSGSTSKQIVLNAGGGLRIGADAPVHLDLFAEDMMFRVDRFALFNQGSNTTPLDPDRNMLRHNVVIGAAIGIPLGLNTDDRERNRIAQQRWGLNGASLTLEPFAGRMSFDDKGTTQGGVKLPDQELAGVRAGIDVGRYVGVRGFYWRGTDKHYKRFESMQSWGGELQFRLNSSPGLTPYLLAGAAQLDFRSDDSTSQQAKMDDKLSLLLGGGVSLPLGERFSVNASARDYLYGQGNGADSVSSPSDLRNNWMFSLGLRVSLAGRSGSNAAERAVNRMDALSARLHADSVQWLATRDSLIRNNSRARNLAVETSMSGDSLIVVDGRVTRVDNVTAERLRKEMQQTDSAKRGTSGTPGYITIPVPTVGELYVRYGPPQGMTTRFPELTADSSRMAAMSAAEREAFISRQIDSIVTVRVNERTRNLQQPAQPTQDTPPAVIVNQPAAANPTAASNPPTQVVVESSDRYQIIGSDTRGGLMVYSGLTASSDPQISLGGRFDLGPIGGGNSKFHFAPEIAIGGGSGGRSTMVVANAQYMFNKRPIGSHYTIQPHVVAGIGLLNFSHRVGSRDGLEGVINLGYGASIPLTRNAGSRATPVLTVEHQGIDFFKLNRLLVGLSWRL